MNDQTTIAMKRYQLITMILVAFMMIAGVRVKAQGSKYGKDSVQCVTHFSLYREFYKQKNFQDAIPHWNWVFNNCPLVSQNLYIDGVKILTFRIGEAKDAQKRDKLIDTLMMVYDQRVKYFGQTKTSREGMVRGRQALDLNTFRPSDTLKVYDLLRRSLELEGKDSDPIIAANYFIVIDNLVKGKRFPVDSIVSSYDYLNEFIDANLLKNKDTDTAAYSTWLGTRGTLEAIFEPYATCDQLIRIFGKKFDQIKDDTTALQRIIKVLDKKNCNESDLFNQATEQLHKLNPNPTSAYYLGMRYLSLKDNAKASSYFLEAIPGLEDDKKAKAYYYLAVINFTDKDFATARSYALKALAVNPNDGKSYILIGNCYAATASSCGNDEIGKRAGYWAAVDKFSRAKQVDNDPQVIEDANSNIATYSRYFPNTERLFFYDYQKGQSYTINCWYSETTTVRSSD